MELILKQDIPNIGNKDELVTVKNGYGRNYLIPKGFAILATGAVKKVHAENVRQRTDKEDKIKNEALKQVKNLENITLTIGAKTSSKGKIFGSITTIQIANAIKEKGFDIDRKSITISQESIKEVGEYTANITLHKDVNIEIPFEVVAE